MLCQRTIKISYFFELATGIEPVTFPPSAGCSANAPSKFLISSSLRPGLNR
jgi:hypothetical protein